MNDSPAGQNRPTTPPKIPTQLQNQPSVWDPVVEFFTDPFVESAASLPNHDDSSVKTLDRFAELMESELEAEPLSCTQSAKPVAFPAVSFQDDPFASQYAEDPYCYEHGTVARPSGPVSSANNSDWVVKAGKLKTDEVLSFLVEPGGVIEVDGAQGYDHIDLACFDVSKAEIGPGLVRINDSDCSFEVRFRDIEYILFEGNVRVDI